MAFVMSVLWLNGYYITRLPITKLPNGSAEETVKGCKADRAEQKTDQARKSSRTKAPEKKHQPSSPKSFFTTAYRNNVLFRASA